MKVFQVIILVLLVACNNTTTDTAEKDNNSISTAAPVTLPYSVQNSSNKEVGNEANVAIAMKTLRAFETNNFDAMDDYLADSVIFNYRNGSFRGSKDSLIKIFKGIWNNLNNVRVRMHNYESIKRDGNEEWIQLTYTQINADRNGNIDSILLVDKVKVQGGRVAEIDSKAKPFDKQ